MNTKTIPRHDTLPKFQHGRQVPTLDSTGRPIAPPYMIRAVHRESGTVILRRATREEIRNRDKRITMQPLYFWFCNKWMPLTPRGAWAATDVHCKFRYLTNSNGDTVGIGIY
jgi:hypothetical protein